MINWKSIETAPKDGRQILTVGYWSEEYPIWYQTSFYSLNHYCWSGWPKEKQPAYWSELPFPPEMPK